MYHFEDRVEEIYLCCREVFSCSDATRGVATHRDARGVVGTAHPGKSQTEEWRIVILPTYLIGATSLEDQELGSAVEAPGRTPGSAIGASARPACSITDRIGDHQFSTINGMIELHVLAMIDDSLEADTSTRLLGHCSSASCQNVFVRWRSNVTTFLLRRAHLRQIGRSPSHWWAMVR